MSAYRFCRTDDIALLVDAWNRCSLPHDPSARPLTVAAFKQDIRELDLWCSSCMVGFEADEPVAVIHGCKRPPETLVIRIAVHPDHLRKGHGRHLLTSLSAKLSILGPPRLVAEIPEANEAARGLFEACGWKHEGTYYDVDLGGRPEPLPSGAVTPIGLEDVPEAGEPGAWACSAITLAKRTGRLRGLALVSPAGVEASVLYTCEEDGVAVWSARGAAARALAHEAGRREEAPVTMYGRGIRELGARPVYRYAAAATSA